MPHSPSAGLLAFLLALPPLALVVPPASEAGTTPGTSMGMESLPGEAMEARLQRLSEAIQHRAGQLEPGQREMLPGDSWMVAGAWGNGRGRGGWGNGGGRGWGNGGGRGWGNRAWGNGSYGNSIYVAPGPVWANFRPGWNNFRNGPSFLNW